MGGVRVVRIANRAKREEQISQNRAESQGSVEHHKYSVLFWTVEVEGDDGCIK
jgi:hypothetical protein